MSGEERVIIVDRNNQPCTIVARSVMRANGLRHRASAIFVFDNGDRLFVQRRTRTKDVYPGLLDLCAGGVVVEGESYERCAEREAQEELGIVDTPLEPVFDSYYADRGRASGGVQLPGNRVWSRIFIGRHDGPFTLQAEEVADGEFRTLADILADHPGRYTPDSRKALRGLLERRPLRLS